MDGDLLAKVLPANRSLPGICTVRQLTQALGESHLYNLPHSIARRVQRRYTPSSLPALMPPNMLAQPLPLNFAKSTPCPKPKQGHFRNQAAVPCQTK